jgi:hypothetical protein
MAAFLPELPPPEFIAGLFARFLSERRIVSFGFAPPLGHAPLDSGRASGAGRRPRPGARRGSVRPLSSLTPLN